jgi:hypothetical protein
MSSNTDGDRIFAFDVSKKLMDAQKKGNKISFLLEAISNSSSEIDFLSRESGQGPYLMIMPYPTASLPAQTLKPAPASQDGQTFFLTENASKTSETSKMNETVPATTVLKTDPKSNEKISKKLILP